MKLRKLLKMPENIRNVSSERKLGREEKAEMSVSNAVTEMKTVLHLAGLGPAEETD
jgi:hypothetical protein